MAVQFTIQVTKEILKKSKNCGTRNDIEMIGENCAIAIALKDIFPEVCVTGNAVYPFGNHENSVPDLKIEMPKIAQDFIKVFDSLSEIPNVRLLLPEFEFEITISDEIISKIDIDEVREVHHASATHAKATV